MRPPQWKLGFRWWGSEWSDRVEWSWSRPSVASRGVPLLSLERWSSEPESSVSSKWSSSRTRSFRGLVAGDRLPAVPRASSSEEDIFIESTQSTKASLIHRWGEWLNYAPSCGTTTAKRSTVSQRGGPAKAVRDYDVPMFGRLFGAQGANIRDLGGETCHWALHRVWEYLREGVEDVECRAL